MNFQLQSLLLTGLLVAFFPLLVEFLAFYLANPVHSSTDCFDEHSFRSFVRPSIFLVSRCESKALPS